MNAKPTPRKWTDVQLTIAAISMTSVLAFWNMFAGPDRSKADEKAVAAQQSAQAIPTTAIVSAPATPAPTMPPPGYTILFGGTAPQPQVIVMQSGGGGGGNQGGGDPVTVTTSS